jgi:signal transduction histidine kinase
VEVHGHPIFNELGEVSQIIEYCLDITDRKEMEESLRRAHDELELRVQQRTSELASANSALMSEIAERKRIEEALRLDERRLEALLELDQIPWASESEIANYVLDQLIRLTRSEIGTMGFLDEEEKMLTLQAWSPGVMPQCASPAECPHFLIESGGLWADSIRKREPVIVNDYAVRHEGNPGLPVGHIPLRRFTSIPIFDGERIVALAIVGNKNEDYDQSDVRQLTLLMDGMWKLIQRENSIKALKEAENLAAIGKALAGVAHDMKTPLVAIGGFTKLVHRHLGKGHPDSDKMLIVLNETARLEKLVKDMLDFSKPLSLEKSLEEIGPIIDESLAIAKPTAEKHGVALKIEFLYPVPAILLDRNRMKQVFINLFTNAIQASPEGTTVVIRYRSRGAFLILDVADCGCGIPPEKRRDIFVPFFTTKKEGTGLGLPIVGKIIEAHKGHVEVLSNVCGGITFRILLPCS